MNILFISSRDVCRGPIAVALFKEIIINSINFFDEEINVSSAGIRAVPGLPATQEAQLVMREIGLNLNSHKSKCVTKELLSNYDLILTMERCQEEYLFQIFREARGKVFTLSEYVGERGDVQDPYENGICIYRETANRIKGYLLKLKSKLQNEMKNELKMKIKPTWTSIVYEHGLKIKKREWDVKGSFYNLSCPFCGDRLIRQRSLKFRCENCNRTFSIRINSFTLINDEVLK